ncbi:biotin--[acetyl-CoA-carboxylase] ligase [Myxococcota bacterium]|nr:biotin--[acetyl-CoA-carboxylase] ligase [Myxococcota bacterium]
MREDGREGCSGAPPQRRLETCASTNSEAAAWMAEGAPHGASVVADAQTGGRGRRGRSWYSPPGAGLWVSVVLRPRIGAQAAPLLAVAAGVAARDALAAAGVPGVTLKWPNDLMLAGRKMGGVLAELHGRGAEGGLACVLGLGVNLSLPADAFPEELKATATSPLREVGAAPDRDAVLDAFLPALLAAVEALESDGGSALVRSFAASLHGLGSRVEVTLPGGTLRGIAEGIGPGGELLVRDGEGALRRVLAGDVRLVEGPGAG